MADRAAEAPRDSLLAPGELELEAERDRRFGFGFHLNQGSPALADVGAGESVWAFTRNPLGHYVLASELVVRAVTRNAPK